jgi:phosphatidylserine/phosphatidylglycerophosphate/cardiolipin synthase-like enzyme
MAAAIDATGQGPGDYVFMLNWFADPFLQIPGRDTLGALLVAKLQFGVQVRAILWKNPADASQNRDLAQLLNAGYVGSGDSVLRYLPNGTPAHSRRGGAAVVDDRLTRVELGVQLRVDPFTGAPMNAYNPVVMTPGSHHQKVLCVKAGDSLVAFCGGIDFNPDRVAMVYRTFHGAPLHDVHCRVVGPAASNLLQTFVDRWMDHPDARGLDAETGEPLRASPNDLDPSRQPSAGRVSVQVGRTFGAGPLMAGPGTLPGVPSTEHYAFAQSGETTARDLIKNAIAQAKKFIYIEDQYFVNWEATQALVQALQNGIAHLTIVLPHHSIGDLPGMVGHRRRCLKALKAAGDSRVRVFYKCGPGEKPGDYHTYVHSKLTIVDDVFAVVGSVNYNRRSWQFDSEICIGVYDPSTDRVLTNRFARWLRMRMWAEHLFGIVVPPSDAGSSPDLKDQYYAELFDGVAAGAHWQELLLLEARHAADKRAHTYDQSQYNSVATVRPYDTNFDDPPQEILPGSDLPVWKSLGGLLIDEAWDSLLDPGVPGS